MLFLQDLMESQVATINQSGYTKLLHENKSRHH
uniref:Uncharacterized protein n=1 Tax=Rhizophora mucronata TaxID=61149 RepID=A0A2P2NME5_RHIMU